LRDAINADDVVALETLWSGNMRTREYKTGDSPLIHACRIGSIGSVRWLVFAAGVNVYGVNKNGYTALCIEAQNGHIEVVQFLVCEAKVDVNRQAAGSGFTPLYLAIQAGPFYIVRWLVKDGKAAVNEYVAQGVTPLFLPHSWVRHKL
jgi:ankyrin repeat protein